MYIHKYINTNMNTYVGYWYKSLTFYRKPITQIFQRAIEGQIDIVHYFNIAERNTVAKNEITALTENCRFSVLTLCT